MSTKRCPFCKEELPESATFCPACFCELFKANAATTVKRLNVKRIIISSICIIIALILLLMFFVLKPSENTLPKTQTTTFQATGFKTPLPYITATAPVETVTPLGTSFSTPVSTGVSPTMQTPTPTIQKTATTTPFLTETPTTVPTIAPTITPTTTPTIVPTITPTTIPTIVPTITPTIAPTEPPSTSPEPDESLWSYTISNNQATIKDYYGADQTVIVPATLGGAPVYEIAANAFFGNNVIQEVYIPNSVKAIGNSVFSNCSNLKSVYMEDSVTTLGAEVFFRCENLQAVRLSNNIKVIPKSCFSLSRKLHTVNMPTSLTTILSSAFDNTAITTLSLPATVTTLPNMFCVYMPELEEITVAGGNTTYWSQDGVLFKRNVIDTKSTLVVYPGGKKDASYTIPAIVNYIYSNAFCENAYIEHIQLSQQTSYIYAYAFSGCTALTTVTTYNGLAIIQEKVFNNCTNLTSLNLTSYVTKIYSNTFANCPNLILTVEEGSYAHTYAIDNNIPYTLKK